MKQKIWLLVLLLSLLAAAPPVHATNNPWVTVFVDLTMYRRAINPNIYGMCAYPYNSSFPQPQADLNCPVYRLGGDSTSTYNWHLNAYNHAFWWYFEGDTCSSSATPGEAGDTFITQCKAAGTQAMLTIPTIGWVANLKENRDPLWSFSKSTYASQGPQVPNSLLQGQAAYDPAWPDAGSGILIDNQDMSADKFVTGHTTPDAYVPGGISSNPTTGQIGQTDWVQHLIATWGKANAGGLRYYILDNEPAAWHLTHPDIHPTGAMMGEIAQDMISYSQAIKALDPGALVVGPEETAWDSYFFSGYDLWYGHHNGWGVNPDRTANGGMDYLPWVLSDLYANDQKTGQRTLDVFTVHYYPGEYNDDVSAATQLLRNRSTRALWDQTYQEPSITDYDAQGNPYHPIVNLISRLQGWVSANYPTNSPKIGITEYSWGADADINGATAQADVLGIFGRQGLDLATRYTTPDPSTPTYQAIKMYRNYDGHKSTFGDTSIRGDASGNPDQLSVFAAERAKDGAVTIMVINKVSGTTPVEIWLTEKKAWSKLTASVWQLTAANSKITRLPDMKISGGWGFDTSVPGQSITLYVVKRPGSLSSLMELLLGG